MKRLVWALLSLSLVTRASWAHAADAAVQSDQQTSISAECSAAMKGTVDGYNAAYAAHEWQRALSIASDATVSCQADRLAREMLDTMRAEAAFLSGDAKGALTILSTPGVGTESAHWLLSRFVRLAALRRLGSNTEYRSVRDEMVSATEQALTSGSKPYMAKVERFETDHAVIDAFEEIPRGRSLREVFFLASPKDGSMPISVSVSFRMRGRKAAPLPHMDMTWCAGNELIITDKNARRYADLKAQATRALSGASDPASALAGVHTPSNWDDPREVCPQASFIFRGLAPD